jgi:hypothetical protein
MPHSSNPYKYPLEELLTLFSSALEHPLELDLPTGGAKTKALYMGAFLRALRRCDEPALQAQGFKFTRALIIRPSADDSKLKLSTWSSDPFIQQIISLVGPPSEALRASIPEPKPDIFERPEVSDYDTQLDEILGA